ncbi:hypothetical protein D3C84_1167660 [compost metagenome]
MHVVVTLGERFHRPRVVGAHADAEELADTASTGGIEGGIKGAIMGSQVEAVQVAMGVDQHASRLQAQTPASSLPLAAGARRPVTSYGWDGRT